MQTATTGHPHLQWSHPSNDGVGRYRTGYKIYRRFLPDQDWQVLTTVANNINSYTDATYNIADPNHPYGNPISYCISSINGTGFESLQTDTVQVKRPNTNFPQKKKGTSTQVSDFSISQCYPNPFNPSTNITYSLAEKSFVEISVFDNMGKEVEKLVSETKDKGVYETKFIANNLSSGIYFYSIRTGKFNEVKKMLLLK